MIMFALYTHYYDGKQHTDIDSCTITQFFLFNVVDFKWDALANTLLFDTICTFAPVEKQVNNFCSVCQVRVNHLGVVWFTRRYGFGIRNRVKLVWG